MKISPDMDDYFSMFGLDDEEIVPFIRENIEIDETALNDFLSKQKNQGRTDAQVSFIKQLIVFIYENGDVSANAIKDDTKRSLSPKALNKLYNFGIIHF